MADVKASNGLQTYKVLPPIQGISPPRPDFNASQNPLPSIRETFGGETSTSSCHGSVFPHSPPGGLPLLGSTAISNSPADEYIKEYKLANPTQQRAQLFAAMRVFTPKAPSEAPPLDISTSILGQWQSTSDAFTTPADLSPNPTLTGTTSREVPPSVLAPVLDSTPAANANALGSVPPTDAEHATIYERPLQPKALSKRVCKNSVSSPKSKRVRTRVDNALQEIPSFGLETNGVNQAPVATMVEYPKDGITASTTQSGDLLEGARDSIIQTLAKRLLSKVDIDPLNDVLEQPGTVKGRTITMEELRGETYYGQQRYHFIIQEDRNFWIVKCAEHGVHFGKGVKQGAAKHLNSKAHGLSGGRNVLHHLGYRITNCTETLARENKVFEAKLKKGYKPLNLLASGRFEAEDDLPAPKAAIQTRQPSEKQKKPRRTLQLSEPPNKWQKMSNKHLSEYPIPGKMYAAHYHDVGIFGVMILPWFPKLAKKSHRAVKGMMDRLLAIESEKDSIPECFSTTPKLEINGWARGYENGGAKVTERLYPVRWFDAEKNVGWVLGSGLLGFDFENERCGHEKIQMFAKARNEYAKILGYRTYADMKAKVGVPEMSRPISSGIVLDSDSECEADKEENADTKIQVIRGNAAEQNVDVDMDEETIGFGVDADVQIDLDIDHQQPTFTDGNSGQGAINI